MREDCVFFYPVRVRYAEVDQQGIVYNGSYLVYTDVAFTEFLRYQGYSYRELVNTAQFEVCHVKSTIVFKSSAFEDDLIDVGIRVVRIGTKSFTLAYELYRQGENEQLVEAECVYAGYDPRARKSRPLSDLVRSLLQT